MRVLLPDIPEIPEAECTPLVRKLLEMIYLGQECIQQLQERIQQLEDEIARLKGLKTRPKIAPSSLEKPPRPPRDPGAKRPGSAKRSKTAELIVTAEEIIPLIDKPSGSIFKGYEDFVVQDLELKPRVIRYRREHWMTPDGHSVVAPLPADVPPGSHFGFAIPTQDLPLLAHVFQAAPDAYAAQLDDALQWSPTWRERYQAVARCHASLVISMIPASAEKTPARLPTLSSPR